MKEEDAGSEKNEEEGLSWKQRKFAGGRFTGQGPRTWDFIPDLSPQIYRIGEGKKRGGPVLPDPDHARRCPNALGKGMSFGVGEGELARKGDYDV